MFIYPAYTKLKAHLNHIAPVFMYMGQYNKGKANTSFIVPAIYIELPKDSTRSYWGRGVRVIRNGLIKIHYISNAPFKNHDSALQEQLINKHVEVLKQIHQILNGIVLKDDMGTPITQQLISSGSSELNFISEQVYSILMYTTEIYG